MQAVIAQYYKSKARAEKKVEENQRAWKGKLAWYIVCAPNGYFVISETAARLSYPQLDFSFKDRKYIVTEYLSPHPPSLHRK